MERTEQIKQALNRIKELKESTGYKEIEDYLLNKEEETYFLEEVDSENKFDDAKIQLKKYVLKSDSNSFIKPIELNKGKKLYEELQLIITKFLGDDYLQIVFFENNSRYRSNEEFELFNLIFKRKFAKNKVGKISVLKTEVCPWEIKVGDMKNTTKSLVSIGIDLVYKNSLRYEGFNLKAENILFYGHNVEVSPYLIKLLEHSAPKKILNIVPIGNSNSFFLDNVD